MNTTKRKQMALETSMEIYLEIHVNMAFQELFSLLKLLIPFLM